MLRVLDLFSGIGGFSLGLERTGGFETVAFCEIEEFPRRVLAKHWPGVPIYDDVRTLTGNALRRDRIAVDVICGGFPCQDISLAGKRAGLEGARSGLWREYARLIGELRPRFVIVENVPGLLNLGMGTVLGDLAALGYDATWDCIPAVAVGAPHRRDRVWIVAHANDARPQGRNSAELQERSGEWIARPSNPSVADPQRFGSSPKGNRCINSQETGDRKADRSGGGSKVLADPSCELSYGNRSTRDRWGQSSDESWWVSEPDVGRDFDGFPDWLDRCVGRGLSYVESSRRSKALRSLWNDHVSQALQRAAGGFERIQQAEVLFAFVREYEAGTDEARLLVEGAKASEEFLRVLRERAIARSASRRSGQQKQRAEQYPDALQPLSRLLACNGEAHWAGRGWEDAVPRVLVGVPSRVDRLKGLGNAVVPQITEMIGRAILGGM